MEHILHWLSKTADRITANSGNFAVDTSADFREILGKTEYAIREFVEQLRSSEEETPGEVFAQATIALRCVEDARMRFGKVIQYSQDGVSIYDK